MVALTIEFKLFMGHDTKNCPMVKGRAIYGEISHQTNQFINVHWSEWHKQMLKKTFMCDH